MAIIITKAKGTTKPNVEPVILLTEDVVELNNDNIKIYGASTSEEETDPSYITDDTDVIFAPDVEFKSGSLESVLDTIGDEEYQNAIIVTNGHYNKEGTTPTFETGQSYDPNVIVAKGKIVTSPILGIDINTDMDNVTEDDAEYEKELYIGLSKINGKTVDFEKHKISNNKEIYDIMQKIAELEALIDIPTVTLNIDNTVEDNITIHEDNNEITAERFFEILSKFKQYQLRLNVELSNNNTEAYNYFVTTYANKCILSIAYGKQYTYEITVVKNGDNYDISASVDTIVVIKSSEVTASL